MDRQAYEVGQRGRLWVLPAVEGTIEGDNRTLTLPPRNVGQPNLISPLMNESSPIVRSKGSRGSCGHRAVVVHAALNPSPRKRRPEEGEGMGDEWERGGGVTGRYLRRCPAESPLVCSAFF
eukprot:scaffold1396_cov116-Isochrysis_galbana.AAC.6